MIPNPFFCSLLFWHSILLYQCQQHSIRPSKSILGWILSSPGFELGSGYIVFFHQLAGAFENIHIQFYPALTNIPRKFALAATIQAPDRHPFERGPAIWRIPLLA